MAAIVMETLKTEDKIYAIFVKKEAETMLEVAKDHGLPDRIHLIHFLNGASAILLKVYPAAEKEFAQAVELYPNDNAEKGDWIAHLDAPSRKGPTHSRKLQWLNIQTDKQIYTVMNVHGLWNGM